MKTYTIYKHTNILTGKSYIGQTCQTTTNRWKNGTGYSKDTQPVFYNAIKKYGWENFRHEILEKDILTLEEANEKEKYWINYFHTWIYDENCNGYNATQGGDGNPGHKVSEEARLKMSLAHQGQTSWAKGKTFSEEHKKKLSEAHTGKTRQKHSEETKAKMRKAALGKKKSELTCKKISKAKKGSTPWNKGKVGVQSHSVSDETKLKIAKANGITIACENLSTKEVFYYYSVSEAIRQLQPNTKISLTYHFRKLTHFEIDYILLNDYKLTIVKEKEN